MFLNVVEPLRCAWEKALAVEGAVDFDDMVMAGCEHLESGRWRSPYTLVMVDEFQDVSPARERMIKALTGDQRRHLFAVGDDWQSINGFAGSDPTIMQRFEEVFGVARTLQLTQTFRFPQSIADAAGQFVKMNKKQLDKDVVSKVPEPNTRPTLQAFQVAHRTLLPAAVDHCLEEIAHMVSSRASDASQRPASVLVLGRYNADKELYMPENCIERHAGVLDIRFSTIHKLKGGESDHVVLPGLVTGSSAFPSLRADDPVMRLVNPLKETDDAEERRLFYVALTRARSSLVILTAADGVSPFVNDLVDNGSVTVNDLDNSDPPYGQCPRCRTGILMERIGKKSGKRFLGCSRYPQGCTYRGSI